MTSRALRLSVATVVGYLGNRVRDRRIQNMHIMHLRHSVAKSISQAKGKGEGGPCC